MPWYFKLTWDQAWSLHITQYHGPKHSTSNITQCYRPKRGIFYITRYHISKRDTSHVYGLTDPNVIRFMSRDEYDDADPSTYHYMTSYITSGQQ